MSKNNPVKKLVHDSGSYYYETNKVNSGRKDKWCDVCGNLVKKGTPHSVWTLFNSEFYSIICCGSCTTTYKTEIEEMHQGKYDNY